MGYFPLPELKGKPNRIFVDGKTLNQIAKESGIRLDTVQHRYSRGIRDYEGLTKPSHIRVEHEKTQRKTYSIMSAGERVMERIWELDIPLQTISDKTGISRSTIYAFLYNGTDLSSMRLAKICSLLGLSMVRQIKRKWRRFYRTHREGCELVGDFIGAVSIFVFLFELYIIGVMLGGH